MTGGLPAVPLSTTPQVVADAGARALVGRREVVRCRRAGGRSWPSCGACRDRCFRRMPSSGPVEAARGQLGHAAAGHPLAPVARVGLSTLAAMARYFDVHPVDPQPRVVAQAVALLRDDA
jgi:hypothetical protein